MRQIIKSNGAGVVSSGECPVCSIQCSISSKIPINNNNLKWQWIKHNVLGQNDKTTKRSTRPSWILASYVTDAFNRFIMCWTMNEETTPKWNGWENVFGGCVAFLVSWSTSCPFFHPFRITSFEHWETDAWRRT